MEPKLYPFVISHLPNASFICFSPYQTAGSGLLCFTIPCSIQLTLDSGDRSQRDDQSR